jgi:hypothetical protein
MASLISPEVTLSYPHLFKARLGREPKPGDKPKYSTTCLLTKDAVASDAFKQMQADVLSTARDRFGPTVTGKVEWVVDGKDKGTSFYRYTYDVKGKPIEGTLRLPWRNDIAARGYPPDYVLSFNSNATENPDKPGPQVVGRDRKALTDPREIFAGCRAHVSFGPFAYDNNGNKGVSLGLRNVQKTGEGKRLDSFVAAEDEFGALDPEDRAEDIASMLD